MGSYTLTQDELKSLILYDKDTGVFTSKKSGKVVGWKQSGYLKYELNKKKYYLHRLAWLYIYGDLPKKEIDHIDRNRSNNKISNLREASRTENRYNTRVRCDNITGLKGVEYLKKLNKYRAVISTDGKRMRLGTFSSALDAYSSYIEAAKILHKEFAFLA